MIRKIVLTIAFCVSILLVGTAPAFAASTPPADTTVTYARGSSVNIVMLDTNLSKAERADITEYDLRVVIDGQPTRNLTVKTLPTTLFNIIPGTRLQAYLTLKGAGFGTSAEYAGKPYVQGTTASSTTPTSTPSATPTPTPTGSSASPTPSPSTATESPSPSAAAPSNSATTPVASPSTRTTAAPTKTTSNTDVLSLVKANPLPIILIAILTAVLLELLFILYRRRKHNQNTN